MEGLDVSRLTKDVFLGHANIDVGTLLEELRSLAGITDDEQRHHQLGSHIVQTASQEVLGILVLQSLHVGQSLLIDGNQSLDSLAALKARVEKLIPVYEEALNNVKALENQDAQDFLARRLYDMTAELVMSLLILRDATKAPELFEKSANVYVRMTEEDVFGKSAYIKAFQVEDLASFKAASEQEE